MTGLTDETYVRVGALDGISPTRATIVPIGRYEVAVFRLGDDVAAYENACPHQGGPVGEGIVEEATVTCPWHAWCFDLRTGKLTLGDFAALRRFRARVEDGIVFVAGTPEDAA